MRTKNRFYAGVVAFAVAMVVATAAGYYAGAAPGLHTKKTLEQRIGDVELKIAALEMQMHLTRSKVDTALQPGPMLLNQ